MYKTFFYVYQASMKIEELFSENAWLTYEFRMHFQILFQLIMDVDFISKDMVLPATTQRIM